MQQFYVILVLVVSLLVLIVILQNKQSVETKLLWITITMPRALLLIICFLAGVLTGLVTAYYL